MTDSATPIDGHFYKLVNRKPVPCTLAEYAIHAQKESNRIVAQTTVDAVRVSTVFTGIDRAFGTGEKQLFETILFGLSLPDEQHPRWQYASWEEAQQHHLQLVADLQAGGVDSLIRQIMEKSTSPHC
ncbi:MAG: hypothetical protein LBK01_01885 [Burkholderiaceae bacterium]|jgi:hypothetical protein|nr:hypothetical protein [Burkholderiaceae bacterium]